MKVLNFGSLNIDMVYAVDHFGGQGRSSRPTGCTLLRWQRLNQSVALARAGATSSPPGWIGRDGGKLSTFLPASGADTRFRPSARDEASGHCHHPGGQEGQNRILLYGGANLQITEAFARLQVLAACVRGRRAAAANESQPSALYRGKGIRAGMEIALNPVAPSTISSGKLPLEKIRYFILNEIEGRS